MGYCKQIDELFEADSDHADAVAAAAAAAGRYTFLCRQDDNAPPSPLPDWYDLFHVNVLAYYKNLENDVLVLRSYDNICMPRELFLERRPVLETVFVSTLYRVDIPQAVVESIFDEVIRLARSMVVDDGNNVVHRQVLPMTVEIVISENEEEMSARTLRDSRVDEASPALLEMQQEAADECEWAISQVTGGLEKVALESCSVKPQCAICLDTILVGNRMPCSHIYHGHCICRWLRKSSLCPLCRFAMPCNVLR